MSSVRGIGQHKVSDKAGSLRVDAPCLHLEINPAQGLGGGVLYGCKLYWSYL